MSDIFDEQGDINWKTVMDHLGKGHVVEIPCATERELERRTTQVVKRAEKRNIGIEVLSGENSLRIQPRAGADPGGAANPVGQTREDRQRERAQRREAQRAERGNDR